MDCLRRACGVKRNTKIQNLIQNTKTKLQIQNTKLKQIQN